MTPVSEFMRSKGARYRLKTDSPIKKKVLKTQFMYVRTFVEQIR